MKSPTNIKSCLILFLSLCALLSCGPGLNGGTGSGGEAIVIGKVVNVDGTPESGARVMLLPYDFDPVTDKMSGATVLDTTDNRGEYRLAVSQPYAAQYTLQVIGATEQTRSLITGILIPAGNSQVLTQPQAVLQKTGAIKVKLPAGTTATNGYFFIPGTTIYSMLSDSTSDVLLDSVPAGVNLSVEYAVRGSSALPQLVRDAVIVAPGGSTTITNVGWMHSKQIFLNTTSSGADVAGAVTGFPALIRLTSSNFTFTEARQDGADLRFAKPDGTLLPYEIERWDYLFSLAEIWVKIDTVYGNSNSQNIIMYWGNSNASNASNSAAVFDTARGFQGVWHLNEATGQAATDATANHFDGTPSDTAPTIASGIVGLAQEFNGISNYLRIRGTASGKLNFAEADTFTVSAWVYVDSLVDSTSHLIVGKGHQQYYLKLFFGPQGQHWEFTEYLGGTTWQITYALPVAKSWKFLFGMRQGNSQFLYIDGVPANSNTSAGYPNAIKDTSNDVAIGRYLTFVTESNQGFAFFNGAIDEVRISNVSQSANWIKLCYMNQKRTDALVQFK